MEFKVSARKWRPQKFSELIGQEHIVRTLKNALEMDRISHAYLFSGTRGVGKTTTARILAKALNCTEPEGVEPCDHCAACVEIREGASIDVREIDGASNNGVAEVRDLIENVQYATSSLKHKVYIIDEVHMLSKSAFNALLKTLEEPPERVVFVFATTELIKIPETILSRCQCFEFKPLSHKQIVEQLELICKQEGIGIETVSLEAISKNGSGSMRDAQSLLDQVIAFSGQTVTADSVETVLGIVSQEAMRLFVDRVIEKDASALIAQVQEIVGSGKDLHYFCRDLTAYFRNLMMIRVAKNPQSVLDPHTSSLDVLKQQAEAFDADSLQQMFAVLCRAEDAMRRTSMAQWVFEMAVLRLLDARPYQNIDALIDRIDRAQPEGAVETSGNGPAAVVERPVARPAGEAQNENGPQAAAEGGFSWQRMQEAILKRKKLFGHYLTQCRVDSVDASTLCIGVSDSMTKSMMEQPDNLKLLKEAAQQVNGEAMEVTLKLISRESPGREAPATGANPKKKNSIDPGGQGLGEKSESEIIQEALDIFGGVVVR